MKKILFGLILVLSSICAKAQIVADLNSISILGKWNVVDIIGSERSFFNRFGFYVTYTTPKSLDFFSPNSASTAQCRVCFADFSNETSESTYPGYWIEGALLGDNVFILHIWNPSSQEMINLKNEIEKELKAGNEYNLSTEEKAFFDALGDDLEVKELMKDETLVQIAKELVETVNENMTIDWDIRKDARARMRIEIKKLLIKYNYPPNKSEKAVQTVIRQAELKCKGMME